MCLICGSRISTFNPICLTMRCEVVVKAIAWLFPFFARAFDLRCESGSHEAWLVNNRITPPMSSVTFFFHFTAVSINYFAEVKIPATRRSIRDPKNKRTEARRGSSSGALVSEWGLRYSEGECDFYARWAKTEMRRAGKDDEEGAGCYSGAVQVATISISGCLCAGWQVPIISLIAFCIHPLKIQ
jgi:hypothetical protein